MADLTRRAFAGLAAMTGSGAMPGARSRLARTSLGGQRIERYEVTSPGIDVPRISYAVAHGGMVYTAGVTPHLANGDRGAPLGDVRSQTRQVLATIDQLLAMAGTSKSNLLSAQVWLTDMRHFTAHCEAWNEWVDLANPPVRACLHSPTLWSTGMLVEIMVSATR